MLVLSRKVGEKVVIGDNITIVVNKVSGNRIALGIEAPNEVRIVRGELADVSRSFDGEEPASRQNATLSVPVFDLPSDCGVHRAR